MSYCQGCADYEAELERHATDRVNQRKRLAALEEANAELKEVLKAQVVAACNERTAALEGLLEQCEAALKPFAERAKKHLQVYGRYAEQTDTVAVPFAECDAARAALEGK